MPSPFRITLILVFWLAAMTWLAVQEVLPRYRSGEPPGFTIELTDEVGTNLVSANRVDWAVLFQGSKVGSCFSEVRRHADGSFEQKTQYKFDTFSFFKPIELTKVQISYGVTQEGQLLRMAIFIAGTAKPLADQGDIELDLKGKVEDGLLKSTALVRLGGVEILRPEVPTVNVADVRNIINPMHLQNRIPGLWVGRTWSVPMIDSLGALVPGQGVSMPKLQAEVFDDTMEWLGEETPCFRIDHWEPGKEVSARTWVRQRDGLLLKQEARYNGMELVARRIPTK